MTPEAFVAAWDTPLVVLPRDCVLPAGVAADVVDFLHRAGLPRGLAYGERTLPFHLSFARLAGGLTPVLNDQPPRSLPWPRGWRDHFVIGEEWLDGGAEPYWCLHGPSGRVEILDVEADDDAPRLANSTIACLAKSLLALRRWAHGLSSSKESRKEQCQRLRRALEQADPLASGKSDWSLLPEHLEDEETCPEIVCVAESPRVWTSHA